MKDLKDMVNNLNKEIADKLDPSDDCQVESTRWKFGISMLCVVMRGEMLLSGIKGDLTMSVGQGAWVATRWETLPSTCS